VTRLLYGSSKKEFEGRRENCSIYTISPSATSSGMRLSHKSRNTCILFTIQSVGRFGRYSAARYWFQFGQPWCNEFVIIQNLRSIYQAVSGCLHAGNTRVSGVHRMSKRGVILLYLCNKLTGNVAY
jgi:hypothetical protein